MFARTDYFVISFDAGYAKPFGVAWFADVGQARAFTFYASRAECIAHVEADPRRTPYLLSDDSVLQVAA